MNKTMYYTPKYDLLEFNTKKSDYLLVIPVLNERNNLYKQLENISRLKLSIDILVCDGGSTDGTADTLLLKESGVSYLINFRDKGRLSGQLQAAFSFALKSDYLGVITMDGNAKDNPSGIESIKDKLSAGYDFIQGSRFIPGGQAINTPRLRLLGIRLIHAPLTSLASRVRFTDTTNGFRGHSRKLISCEKISIFRDVFEDYELIAYLPIISGQLGLKITEVPVVRAYPKGIPTPTKIHGFKGNFGIISTLIKVVLKRFHP